MLHTAPDPTLEQVRAIFDAMPDSLDLHRVGGLPQPEMPPGGLRRGRGFIHQGNVGMISLIERNGLLFWELGPITPSATRDLRRMRRTRLPWGRLIGQREFVALGDNQIGAYLETLDRQLTPRRGLRQWDPTSSRLVPVEQVAPVGSVLLVIHGTFSNSEAVLEGIGRAANGPDFLRRAASFYKQVLFYDHPTVSVSPMINAIDLNTLLRHSSASVDIICHSRGGLVARWWMEAFDRQSRTRRCVFVAAPLNGTSLASPARLRSGLNALASFGKLLGSAAMAAPFIHAPAAILRVLSSVVSASSRVPLVDAAVAMIPGLNGQSRVQNNAELLRLNQNPLAAPSYSFVRSNFESTDAGWQLWRYVTEGKVRAAEAAASLLVFPKENDLVVDCASMTEVPGVALDPKLNLCDFGTCQVHHTNYFEQPRTINFIRQSFAIP
jgi:hypothetical protein